MTANIIERPREAAFKVLSGYQDNSLTRLSLNDEQNDRNSISEYNISKKIEQKQNTKVSVLLDQFYPEIRSNTVILNQCHYDSPISLPLYDKSVLREEKKNTAFSRIKFISFCYGLSYNYKSCNFLINKSEL